MGLAVQTTIVDPDGTRRSHAAKPCGVTRVAQSAFIFSFSRIVGQTPGRLHRVRERLPWTVPTTGGWGILVQRMLSAGSAVVLASADSGNAPRFLVNSNCKLLWTSAGVR